jgi:hypothetical protein
VSTDFAERKMEVNDLSFDGIVHCLNEVIGKIDDPRSVSNATKYSLREAILGAFAAFFMQNESFLEYQRQLNSRCGRDNAQSLFGLEKIPTVEQIRNIVDGVAASSLFPLFGLIYQALRSMGFLKAYEILRGNLHSSNGWDKLLQFGKSKLSMLFNQNVKTGKSHLLPSGIIARDCFPRP